MSEEHLAAGAYALGAIEDDVERRRFERHLAECAACREEVTGLRETAAALAAGAAVRPPPGLRGRVLAEVSRTPQLPYVPPGAAPSFDDRPARFDRLDRARRSARTRRAAGRRRRTPLLAAAAAMLVAGTGLAAFGVVRWHQATEAERQAQRVLAITGDPAARRAAGKVTGGGTVSVVVSGRQAVLLVNGAAPLADGRVYQLWLVRGSGTVSAGLGPGGARAAGRWSRLLDGVQPGDAVAISVEPSGGSLQPTTRPLTVVPV